jgi:hypothetical protein
VARDTFHIVPVEHRDVSRKDDVMSWKWSTAPLSWSDRCSGCQQTLRGQGDGGIVIWIDSKQYHVAWLLDRLAPPEPACPRVGLGSLF